MSPVGSGYSGGMTENPSEREESETVDQDAEPTLNAPEEERPDGFEDQGS